MKNIIRIWLVTLALLGSLSLPVFADGTDPGPLKPPTSPAVTAR